MSQFEGIETREQISNKSEIERMLDDLKNSAITFENFRKFFDNVKTSNRVTNTQIENLTREYKEQIEYHKNATQKDSFRQLAEDGFIQRDVYEKGKQMNKILIESFSWKSLEAEMWRVIATKVVDTLDDAKALDIKRDALKEMRDMQKAMQEMFIEAIGNIVNNSKERVDMSLENQNERILNLVMMNDEEHRKDRRDIFNFVKVIVDKMKITPEQKEEIIQNFGSKPLPPKVERLYEKEEKKPVTKTKPITNKYDTYDEDVVNEEEDGIDDIVKEREKNAKKQLDENFQDLSMG